MGEEKPRKSLSSSRDSHKAKNPFSRRVKDHSPKGVKNSSSMMRKSWSTDCLALLSNISHRSAAAGASSSSHGLAFAAPPPLPTQLDLPKSLQLY